MNAPIPTFLALTLTLASPWSIGADANAELAGRFVELLRYDEQYAKYQEQCTSMQRSVSPEALVERDSNYFGGIRPGSAKWPAVVAAHTTYYSQACAHPTKVEFMNALASSYAKTLTAKQLRDSLAFYSSPSGTALISAHREAAAAVYDAWNKTNSRYLVDLNARFARDLQTIVNAK